MADRTPLTLNTSEKRIEQVQSSDTVYVPKDLSVYSDIRSAHIDDSNALNTGGYVRTNFLTGGTTGRLFTSATTANNGVISLITVDPASHNGCMNYVELSTGTSLTGTSRLTGHTLYLNSSFAEYEFGARVFVTDLSTSQQEYSCNIGLSSSDSAAVLDNNSILFQYDRYYLGANWHTYTTLSSPASAIGVNTNIAVSTSWQRLYFKVDRNNNAPRVRFYINNSLVSTHTTYIPDSSSNLFNRVSILKSAGTTARKFNIDYVFFKFTYLNRQTRF